jgi:hypothetical protein
MESCAILEAQRMSPAADVWARGRKARAPATGVDRTGAAWPRSVTFYPLRKKLDTGGRTQVANGHG